VLWCHSCAVFKIVQQLVVGLSRFEQRRKVTSFHMHVVECTIQISGKDMLYFIYLFSGALPCYACSKILCTRLASPEEGFWLIKWLHAQILG
jgi:hypothetical protein